ncbi:hypothetical protein AGIG_G14648 [Arapaima gigas]
MPLLCGGVKAGVEAIPTILCFQNSPVAEICQELRGSNMPTGEDEVCWVAWRQVVPPRRPTPADSPGQSLSLISYVNAQNRDCPPSSPR